MHYLEDVIELLEHLPEEVRLKCLELQQLDLHYTEKMDKLKEDSREFFATMHTLSSLESEMRNKELQQNYREASDIADEKVQITEYLQSVLEKYQERVVKDVIEFKTELESDNPAEVELIEKEFIQSITNPSTSNEDTKGFILDNEEDLELQTSSSFMPLNDQEISSTHYNGHGNDVEVTPRRTKQYENFKIPSTFRRPSQSLDGRGSLTRIIDDDIYDSETSPPVKKLKPAPPSRQLAISTHSTQNSRDASPRSSITSNSPRSTSPGIGPPSKFLFNQRLPFMDSASRVGSNVQSTSSAGNNEILTQSRQSMLMKMPSFAEAQSTRGRHRKLTKKVEQMIIGNKTTSPHLGAAPSNRPHPQIRKRRKRTTDEDGQMEEVEEEYEGGEEYEGEEEAEDEEDVDDRAWCYCKQGSAGNMVACDNKNCPYEWFHYECVGIQQPPKGRWYCPTCSMKMNTAQRSRSTSTDHQAF